MHTKTVYTILNTASQDLRLLYNSEHYLITIACMYIVVDLKVKGIEFRAYTGGFKSKGD